jgi:hypothetical protein
MTPSQQALQALQHDHILKLIDVLSDVLYIKLPQPAAPLKVSSMH